jgi:AcrR family transcriptional regulator
MKRKKRKEHITKERHQQILDAAYKVFVCEGFARATTAEIARAAGIAEGTIYNYFDSKRELFTELLKSNILSEPLVEIISQPLQFDKEGLSSIIENRLGMFFDNAELLLLLLSEIQRDVELHRQFVDAVTAPGINLLKAFLESMMKQGVVRPLNTELVARILPAIMIGLTMLRVVEGKGGPLDSIPRKEMVTELVNFNTRAIFAAGISLNEENSNTGGSSWKR